VLKRFPGQSALPNTMVEESGPTYRERGGTPFMMTQDDALSALLGPSSHPNKPTLENYIAYQWRRQQDTLGYRSGCQRDAVALEWLEAALHARNGRRALLDVGSAFGNHIFMLNARMKFDSDIVYQGIEISSTHVAFAQAFASHIGPYSNCQFADINAEGPMPFEDGTFDAVNICDVLEHLTRPDLTLNELRRVTKAGGTLVLSTPQHDTIFKSLARGANSLSRGRLYSRYYRGKDTELDRKGQPIMENEAGHEHISEMQIDELRTKLMRAGWKVQEIRLMSAISGSGWFDEHPFLLSGIMLLEAIHRVLRRPSWAHSFMVRATA
jgi:SAM-dependent methyltransferase